MKFLTVETQKTHTIPVKSNPVCWFKLKKDYRLLKVHVSLACLFVGCLYFWLLCIFFYNFYDSCISPDSFSPV